MPKKRRQTIYLIFATFWILMCFGVSQIDVTDDRSIFPFVNWRLFSYKPSNNPHYDIFVKSCGPKTFDIPIPVLLTESFVINTERSRFYWRLQPIGRLIEHDDRKLGMELLHKLIEQSFVENIHCKFILFRGTVQMLKNNSNEGIEFEY